MRLRTFLIAIGLTSVSAACSSADASPSPSAAASGPTSGGSSGASGASGSSGSSETPAPPGATLAVTVSSAPVLVARGAPASVAITVARTKWDGAVTVSLAGLPSHFTSSSIALAAGVTTAMLPVAADDLAGASPATVTVTAQGGGLSAKATLTVQAPRAAADASFGTGGLVVLPHSDSLQSIAVQPDGKVLALGFDLAASSGSEIVVYRFDASGAPDSTFGTNGKHIVGLHLDTRGGALALQPDGRILAGFRLGPNDAGGFGVERIDANGNIDTTFGSAGQVLTTFATANAAELTSVAAAVDGSVYATCNVKTYSATDIAYAGAVVHYLANGQLDAAFGGGGKAIQSWSGGAGGNSYAHGMVLPPSGEIFVRGGRGPNTTSMTGTFAKLTPGGALDSSYATGGVYSLNHPVASAISIGTGMLLAINGQEAVVRLASSGAIDTTFGSAGGVGLSDRDGPTNDLIALGSANVVAEPSGRLLWTRCNLSTKMLELWAFSASGARDTTFGGSGRVQIAAGDFPLPQQLARASDGRIVALVRLEGADVSALARFFP